jgi:hypothetical protein
MDQQATHGISLTFFARVLSPPCGRGCPDAPAKDAKARRSLGLKSAAPRVFGGSWPSLCWKTTINTDDNIENTTSCQELSGILSSLLAKERVSLRQINNGLRGCWRLRYIRECIVSLGVRGYMHPRQGAGTALWIDSSLHRPISRKGTNRKPSRNWCEVSSTGVNIKSCSGSPAQARPSPWPR